MTYGDNKELPEFGISSLQHQGLLCWGDPNTSNDLDEGAPASHASPTAWKIAYERYQRIHPLLHGQTSPDDSAPTRTLFRWLARYRAAERDLGCGGSP